MPPLTLSILAALLQMHGPDAKVASDHKGLELLLADIRGHTLDPNDPESEAGGLFEGRKLAASKYVKVYSKKYYNRGSYQRLAPYTKAYTQ